MSNSSTLMSGHRMANGVAIGVVCVMVTAGAALGQSTEQQQLFAFDGLADDQFGFSVAIDGDVAIVGAAFDDAVIGIGSAYVYRFDGATWNHEQQLFAADPVGCCWPFGYSVAISGNVALVGAARDETPAGEAAGSAYVFRFNGANWVQEQQLFGSANDVFSLFGFAVAIDGNVAIIAAESETTPPGGIGAGAAYFFRFNGTSWLEEGRVFAANGVMNGLFGESVSISGDVAIVGAVRQVTPVGDTGAAYVYRFNGASWVEEAELNASDAALSDKFGGSVSISGDVAIVGAANDDTAGGSDAGSAYLYRFNGANWVEDVHLFASDGATFEFFGRAVAISGDVAVVGSANGPAGKSGVRAGSAYVYRFVDPNWVEENLVGLDTMGGDLFGQSVAISGDRFIIGAPYDNTPGGLNAGSAYVFRGLIDCNSNGVADDLDVINGTSTDCDGDLFPDECQLNPVTDTNDDGILDVCDCNVNSVLDSEDVDPDDPDGDGVVWDDYNLNGIPDTCETPLVGDAIWINAAGGDFRPYTNWDTDTPGSANGAIFDLDSTYTVTFDLDIVNTNASILDGVVSFDLAGAEYFLSDLGGTSLLVDGTSGANPSLTLSNGSLVGEAVTIADGDLSLGEVHLSGVTWSSDDLVVARLGNGLLEIRDASVAVAASVTIGQAAGSFGRIVADGLGTELTTLSLLIQRGVLEVVNGGKVNFGSLIIFDEGELTGDGTVDGSLLSNVGKLTPLDPSGDPATLTVLGSYDQTEFFGDIGTLNARLGPGGHSVLDVELLATLGGGLIVDLADGYEPGVGESFDVLNAGFVTGAFDVALMPGLADGSFMRVDYGGASPGPGGATIVVENLESLFGFVDPDGVPIAGTPTDVAVGDFDNQDGDDLAITIPDEPNPGSVLVLLNAGTDGMGNWLGFASSVQTAVGRDPSGVTVGQFDAGTDLDIAVTNRFDGTVSVLLNNGSGGFSPDEFPVSVGNQPSDLATADFNNDTFADLLVANAGDDTMHVLNGDGGGVFVFSSMIATGANPVAVDPSDLDNDKDADAIAANALGGTITVAFNNAGVFGTPIELDVGDTPVALAVSDFDGNGFVDLVTADNGDGAVSVILNEGGQVFTPAVSLPVGDLPRSLASIDLEGDSDIDLAIVANNDLGEAVVKVLRNDTDSGQLVFAAADELDVGADPVVVTTGNLDGDGQDDLIAINESLGSAAASGPAGALNVRLNKSNCPWDCGGDDDGDVGIVDFLALLGGWNNPGACDFDGGGVGIVDFLELLSNWGPCP